MRVTMFFYFTADNWRWLDSIQHIFSLNVLWASSSSRQIVTKVTSVPPSLIFLKPLASFIYKYKRRIALVLLLTSCNQELGPTTPYNTPATDKGDGDDQDGQWGRRASCDRMTNQ